MPKFRTTWHAKAAAGSNPAVPSAHLGVVYFIFIFFLFYIFSCVSRLLPSGLTKREALRDVVQVRTPAPLTQPELEVQILPSRSIFLINAILKEILQCSPYGGRPC